MRALHWIEQAESGVQEYNFAAAAAEARKTWRRGTGSRVWFYRDRSKKKALCVLVGQSAALRVVVSYNNLIRSLPYGGRVNSTYILFRFRLASARIKQRQRRTQYHNAKMQESLRY